LEKEFLNADEETFKLIANYYYKNYGNSAGNYLLNTYNSWKRGYTGVSSKTFGRIIECMPKFLSPEKRFYILKEEVDAFFEKSWNESKKQDISLEDINQKFERVQCTMLAFGKSDLQWFIGHNIFGEELVEHYLNICRYVFNKKIILEFKQVLNDLELIKKKLSNFTEIINGASYNVDFFGKTIYVKSIVSSNLVFQPLKTIDFHIDESFKKFGERYFMDELMKLSFVEKKKNTTAVIKSNDIDTFFDNFFELKGRTTNQITMRASFEGEGGTLSLSLEFVPYTLSKKLIYVSILKLSSFISISILLILIVTMFINYWIILSIIALIVWFNFLFPKIKNEIENIKLAKYQIKKYGQQ